MYRPDFLETSKSNENLSLINNAFVTFQLLQIIF